MHTHDQCETLYGMSTPDWEVFKAGMLSAYRSPVSAAVSILSDVQEMISFIDGDRESLKELARVSINRAKALVMEGR